jgi:hypothetical protein
MFINNILRKRVQSNRRDEQAWASGIFGKVI